MVEQYRCVGTGVLLCRYWSTLVSVLQYRCFGTGVPMALVIGYMNLPGEKEKEGSQ